MFTTEIVELSFALFPIVPDMSTGTDIGFHAMMPYPHQVVGVFAINEKQGIEKAHLFDGIHGNQPGCCVYKTNFIQWFESIEIVIADKAGAVTFL